MSQLAHHVGLALAPPASSTTDAVMVSGVRVAPPTTWYGLTPACVGRMATPGVTLIEHERTAAIVEVG